jgi:hypothetical protein
MCARTIRLHNELAHRQVQQVGLLLENNSEFDATKPPNEDQIMSFLEEHQKFVYSSKPSKRRQGREKFVERLSAEKVVAATGKVMAELVEMRKYPLDGGYALLDDDERHKEALQLEERKRRSGAFS